MSYRALNWAWEATLPTSQKFVLVALADMSDENESCFPGQERLAGMTGCSVSTVRRSLKVLEEHGAISRQVRRGVDGMRTSDRYLLHTNRSICTVVSHRSLTPGSPVTDAGVTGHCDGVTPREPPVEPPDSLRIDELFDEFWSAYPIRKGREPARKAFDKALKSASFDVIMAGVAAYKRELGPLAGGKTLDGRTPKWAQGWLNDRRWQDEPDGPSLDDQWRDALVGPADPCAHGHRWVVDGSCANCEARREAA